MNLYNIRHSFRKFPKNEDDDDFTVVTDNRLSDNRAGNASKPKPSLLRSPSETSVRSVTESSASADLVSCFPSPVIASSYEVTRPSRSPLCKEHSLSSIQLPSRRKTLLEAFTKTGSRKAKRSSLKIMETKGEIFLLPSSLTVNIYDVTPPSQTRSCDDSLSVLVPHSDLKDRAEPSDEILTRLSALRVARDKRRGMTDGSSTSLHCGGDDEGKADDAQSLDNSEGKSLSSSVAKSSISSIQETRSLNRSPSQRLSGEKTKRCVTSIREQLNDTSSVSTRHKQDDSSSVQGFDLFPPTFWQS